MSPDGSHRRRGELQRIARATGGLAVVLFIGAFAAAQSEPPASSPASAPTTGPASRFDSPKRDFDFVHMDLELTLTEEDIAARRMHGLVTHWVRMRADREKSSAAPTEMRLDAADMAIEEVMTGSAPAPVSSQGSGQVVINPIDRSAKFRHDGRELIIELDESIRAATEYTIYVRYKVENPRRGLFFVRPTVDEPDRPMVIYTNAEPLQARYWIPCHDWPDTRWTSEVSFVLPSGYAVVCAGRPRPGAPQPVEPDGAGAGMVRHSWEVESPTDPHLLGFAILKQNDISILLAPDDPARPADDDGIRVLAPTIALTSARSAAGHTLRDVPRMIRYFESLVGVPLPYRQYTHVTIPTHFHGGMEHAGFSMIDPALLSTGRRGDVPEERTTHNYIAHMLAHMWFAGIVNYQHVREAWVNEGFATYLHQNWYTQAEGPDAFVQDLQRTVETIARFDRPGRSTPLVPPTLESAAAVYGFGGGLVYWKGAWVLHMLRHELGEATFWAGVKHYLTRHRFGSVTTADMQAAFEHVSGRPLKDYFDQWVYRDGVPVLEVGYEWDETAKSVAVEVRQKQKVDFDHPPFQMPLTFSLRAGAQDRRETVRLTAETERFTFAAPAAPTLFCADPDGALLATLREQKPAELWRTQLRHGPTALTRSRAAEALRGGNEPAVIALLSEALNDLKEFRGVRQRAAQALGDAAPDGEALLGLLNCESDTAAAHQVHAAVMDALAKFPAASGAYYCALRHAGNDQHIVVQAAALRALTSFDADTRNYDAVEAAAAAALPGNSLYVRDAALDVIEELADAGAAALLLPTLDRIAAEKPERASRVIAVLAKLAADSDLWRAKVAARLAELLAEPRPTVRAAVARGLGRVGDDEIVALLRALADRDDVEPVRTAAETAIEAIEQRLEAAK